MDHDLTVLLSRARKGESRAFDELAVRFRHTALSWASSRLRDESEAEDAVQDAFLTAYRELPNLRDDAAFPGWFRRIVRTACDRRMRRPGRDELPLNEATVPQTGRTFADVYAARQELLRALGELNPDFRSCLELHYVAGYRVREISSMLGVPAGTVKRRLHDARAFLRDQVEPPEGLRKELTMERELKGLHLDPAWISHLGCMHACARFAGSNITKPWLWGGTGHAFVINITPDACPSGPTAWKSGMLLHLAANVGLRVDGIQGFKHQPDFAAKQAAAWAYARACIDNGIPCYGWDLSIPEYGVIRGYDGVGYYHSTGPAVGETLGPKPWQELGDTQIGVIELFSVQTCDALPASHVVREAALRALEHAEGHPRWTHPQYHQGADAFRVWAESLESGKAIHGGHMYNAECWNECRAMAVEFLIQAKGELPDAAQGACDASIDAYRKVSAKLREVRDRHPFRPGPDMFSKTLSDAASAELLREGAEAEATALSTLADLAEAL